MDAQAKATSYEGMKRIVIKFATTSPKMIDHLSVIATCKALLEAARDPEFFYCNSRSPREES